MKGKIYTADYMHSTIATFENGYVYSASPCFFEDNIIIGHYDTCETGSRNVYAGASTWQNILIGNVEYNQAYINPYKDTSDLYVRGDSIYDNKKRLVAKFEGNPKDALCACVVCVNSGSITLESSDIQKTVQHSSSTSNDKPNVVVGGAVQDSIGSTLIAILLCIIGIALAIYLSIRIFPVFWGEMLEEAIQEGNISGLAFFYLPLIISYIASVVITYKLAVDSKFVYVCMHFLSILVGCIFISGVIGTIVTVIELLQHGDIFNAILAIFLEIFLYFLVSFVPAIILTLVTWIAVKIKLA